jgi:hypothetical protein
VTRLPPVAVPTLSPSSPFFELGSQVSGSFDGVDLLEGEWLVGGEGMVGAQGVGVRC